MHKPVFSTVALLVLLAAVEGSYGATADRIVAIVGGEPIMRSDIDRFAGRRIKMAPRVFKQTLQSLISERLLVQAADREGIRAKITDQEVDEEVEWLARRENVTLEQLRGKLSELGFSVESHRKLIGDKLAQRKLIDQKIGSLGTVTPEEVSKYYKTHLDEFRQPERRHVRMISVFFNKFKVGTAALARAEAKKQINEITAKLKQGKEMKHLAVDYAETGDDKAASGGDWGWVTKEGVLLPALAEKAFAMKVGEISGRIATELGFHVIKVEELEAEHIRRFESITVKAPEPGQPDEVVEGAQVEIRRKLTLKRREAFRKDYVNRLWQKTCVELF